MRDETVTFLGGPLDGRMMSLPDFVDLFTHPVDDGGGVMLHDYRQAAGTVGESMRRFVYSGARPAPDDYNG